jgi:hypothetical protein
MRRLARSGFEPSGELQQLHDQVAADRNTTQQKVLEAIAKEAHVDLRSIVQAARGPQEQKRRYVVETLARLESQAIRRANQEKDRFHRIRRAYHETFEGQFAGPGQTAQLKFRDVLFSSGDGIPGRCSYQGTGFFSPWIGPDSIATADIAPSTDTPGMWLHPRIVIDTKDCDDTREGMTMQDVTYRMDAPATSFGVANVRVDLIANGIASAHLGDTGWFSSPSSLYKHSTVGLEVYIAQKIGGEWQLWLLVSDTLFVGHGEYVTQIRSLLSGQTYPKNFFIRGTDVDGGEVLCLVQIACSALPIGNHARVRLDFGVADGHGIFLGGVALIGSRLGASIAGRRPPPGRARKRPSR